MKGCGKRGIQMSEIKQTRFKLAMVGITLGLVEAFIKVLLQAFPLVELYGFQVAVIGYFFTVKTISDVKEASNVQAGD